MSYQPPYVPPGQNPGAPPPGGAFGAAPNPFGPPGAYGPPGYAPPGAQGNPFANAANAAGPAITFCAILAAMPLVWRAVWMAGIGGHGSESSYRLMHAAQSGIDGLLGLVAIILFFVWISRLTTAIRATQGTSAYSPGMAIGVWFIPLANFVLPFLAVRDAWKRTMPGDSRGWIVPLWWTAYLAGIFFSILFTLEPGTRFAYHAIGNGGLAALGYAWSIARITAWASLLLTIRWITERTAPQQQR